MHKKCIEGVKKTYKDDRVVCPACFKHPVTAAPREDVDLMSLLVYYDECEV
jgi:hypothetical protein